MESYREVIVTLLIFTVLGGLLLGSVVSPTVAQEDENGGGQKAEFTDFWTDGPGDANKSFNSDGTGTYLGLTAPEYFKLWGYDRDETGSVSSGGEIGTSFGKNIDTEQSENPGEASRMNLSELTGYYNVMDATYKRPPETARKWNKRSSSGLNSRLNGQVHNSLYPNFNLVQGKEDNVQTKGSNRLGGAYIEFYSITPSTTVHYTEDKTITYMRDSGSVITAADYLVEKLETEVNGDVKKTYSLQGHGVDWIRLTTKQNCNEGAECEIKKVSGRQSKVIGYSNLEDHLNASQSNHLYIEGRIYADIQVTKYTYDPCSENEDECGWIQSGQWTETDDVIVSEGEKVALQDLNVTVHAAEVETATNQKDTVLHIENRGTNVSSYWGYADPDGDGIVRTNWKYYTGREIGWDVLLREKRNGNVDSVKTKYRPVNVHAYPTSEGSIAFDQKWNRTQQAKILDEFGSNVSKPKQPDDTMLDWLQKDYYTPANELVVEFKANTGIEPSSSFPVYGLVEGASVSVQPDTVNKLRDVNLEFNVLNVLNTTAAEVEVIAKDAKTGEPIETNGTGDYITIHGQKYQTNENGKVTTTIVKNKSEGSVIAKYEAQEWWEVEQDGKAYKDEVMRVDIFRDGIMGLLNFVVFLLKLAVIILTPVWLLNVVTAAVGIDSWSTVKKIIKDNNPFD